MNAILVSIEMGQFTHVTSYVNKAEQNPETLEPMVNAKLRCASGLAHLELKKYKLAARKFLDVNPELGNSYNEVIAPQDIATYGGLCALASFDRSELKQKVIDNINFRNFLELVPDVRELINDFYSRLHILTKTLVYFLHSTKLLTLN
jgi:COP9 signalosome complex subunit 1